jgi:hypothetical protein
VGSSGENDLNQWVFDPQDGHAFPTKKDAIAVLELCLEHKRLTRESALQEGIPVEQVVATISDGDNVLVQGATAWVQITRGPSGLATWRGSFMQPQGSFVPVGGPYKFETADGRSGQIHVRRNATGTQKAAQVDFNGTGRFG